MEPKDFQTFMGLCSRYLNDSSLSALDYVVSDPSFKDDEPAETRSEPGVKVLTMAPDDQALLAEVLRRFELGFRPYFMDLVDRTLKPLSVETVDGTSKVAWLTPSLHARLETRFAELRQLDSELEQQKSRLMDEILWTEDRIKDILSKGHDMLF